MERIQGELEKKKLLFWKKFVGGRNLERFVLGDKNTKFFHRIANSHRRLNSIDRLMVDGELSSDPKDIVECISHFYRQLY